MIEKVTKIICDWCLDWQETSLKGTGEKRLRKKAEGWGWKKLVCGDGFIRDFCCIECYEYYKQDISHEKTNN